MRARPYTRAGGSEPRAERAARAPAAAAASTLARHPAHPAYTAYAAHAQRPARYMTLFDSPTFSAQKTDFSCSIFEETKVELGTVYRPEHTFQFLHLVKSFN